MTKPTHEVITLKYNRDTEWFKFELFDYVDGVYFGWTLYDNGERKHGRAYSDKEYLRVEPEPPKLELTAEEREKARKQTTDYLLEHDYCYHQRPMYAKSLACMILEWLEKQEQGGKQ